MNKSDIMSKVHAFNSYIGNVSDRDRVMSIVQFTTMALFKPAAAAGHLKLSEDLKRIMELVSQYRAITRFSQWITVGPQLTPSGIRKVIQSSPSKLAGVLRTISSAFFLIFVFGEEVHLFAKYNILNPALGRKFNRIRFIFLFWSNVARLAANYLVLRASPFNPQRDGSDATKSKEHRRKELTVADCVLQTMFAYGLLKNSLPAGPNTLNIARKTGDVTDFIASVAPPVCPIDFTPHGILGIIASIPGFMMSVL